jgi:uncharacterized protein YbjT (DUF2867 family)
MTSTETRRPTLVVGGTGKTGRRVVERLRRRGVPARAVTPSSDPPFDWEDPDTWAPSFEGMHAAYVTFYPDISVAGAPEAIEGVAEQALIAGCRRLVLLSGRGEVQAERAEAALQDSGADWTVVRCSWFMQNFSEGMFAEPLAAGALGLPVGDVRVPFVDADDIADVVVTALTEDGHAGRLYDLTGPRALTHAEAVAEISAATGRDLRYEQITMDAFEAALAEQGGPPDLVVLLRYLFTEVLIDENAALGDGVQRALGRQPRDIAEFARDAAARGVWAAPRVPA